MTEAQPPHSSYPDSPCMRRWSPSFDKYSRYKPWLRDEFCFRCVYCLARETWADGGSDLFGCDHILPKSLNPALVCQYENVVYCCNLCNCKKGPRILIDPCSEALGRHLRMQRDGRVMALTEEGQVLIIKLKINHCKRVRRRRSVFRDIESVLETHDSSAHQALVDLLGFPDDLPILLQDPTHSIEDVPPDSILGYSRAGKLPPFYVADPRSSSDT